MFFILYLLDVIFLSLKSSKIECVQDKECNADITIKENAVYIGNKIWITKEKDGRTVINYV